MGKEVGTSYACDNFFAAEHLGFRVFKEPLPQQFLGASVGVGNFFDIIERTIFEPLALELICNSVVIPEKSIAFSLVRVESRAIFI